MRVIYPFSEILWRWNFHHNYFIDYVLHLSLLTTPNVLNNYHLMHTVLTFFTTLRFNGGYNTNNISALQPQFREGNNIVGLQDQVQDRQSTMNKGTTKFHLMIKKNVFIYLLSFYITITTYIIKFRLCNS